MVSFPLTFMLGQIQQQIIRLQSKSRSNERSRNWRGRILKVDTEDDATAAIDRIAEAVAKVSSQRSALGAVQEQT